MLGCASLSAGAQQLAQRVSSANGSRVQFTFATRDGVCGDGRTYIRSASASNSSYYGSFNDMTAEPCVRGPARVVLDRADGQVVGLRVFVGPPASDGAVDLGAVPARDAAAYLMHLAESGEGAVARDAIMPAMLADSTDNSDALVALARDKSRSRETRRSALSWLGRDSQAPASLVQSLVAIGTDDTDNQTVREQAFNTLARLDAGAGIPVLIRLADDAQGGWVARTALSVISRSGDPRAHDYLRGVVQKAALPDEALGVAIRSFGQQYATAADIKVIRDAWPKFVGEHAHLQPRFVEDSVRVALKSVLDELPGLADGDFVHSRQVNFETIHAHEVVAERYGTIGELRAELAGGEHGPRAHTELRDWLRGA